MKMLTSTNGGPAAITPQQSEAATSLQRGLNADAVATALRCRVRSIPRGARKFFLAAFTLLIVLPSAVLAALPNAWHIPDNAIVTGNGGTTPTMRNPRVEFGNTGTVRVFSGLQKYGNTFGTADQNGGTLYYKSADQGTWSSADLHYHTDAGNDQYWYADLDLTKVTANQVIQYYIGITFNPGNAENAFLYGGGDQDGIHHVTTSQATAAASPYTVRNRPAWVFHSNNRVVNGNSVQFWSKLGYISDPNAPHNADNRWNLDYVKNLGCNWLWFQPIHPIGVEGQTYYPGSPYAVKNFFEINPLMSVGNSRESAMAAFQGFVSAADIKGVKVMLDAPFNHTAPDAEISTVGVPLPSSRLR